jgi:hypothetical protein
VSRIEINQEAGQVLVQVAIMVGVLFGFLALALDGGHFYVERRRMQNAADAGALAGAREICFGDPAQAISAAQEYAITRNDAQWANVQVLDEYTVSVVAGETMDTFFAGLIGLDTADVSAEAAAACGRAVRVCGVWPIAFDADTFTKTNCNQHIILWEDGKAECDVYSCTCSPGFEAVPASDGRTWIDFSAVMEDGQDDACDQTGCGNAELQDRIVGKTNKGAECRSYIEIPSCSAGDSGVKASSWKAAGDEIDKIKLIPLYDPISSPCVMEKDPGNSCGTERWWLVDVGCIKVHGSCNLCKKGQTPPCPSGPKVIDVEILCPGDSGWEYCTAECGATLGGKPKPGDVRAVSLVK